jgi:hypothetical protein
LIGLSYLLNKDAFEDTIYDSYEWNFYCGATYKGNTRVNLPPNVFVEKEAVEVENIEEKLIN